MGVHSAIEFGNRMLTFVVAAVAIATFVVAWHYGRKAVRRLAFLLALGVPAQAVIGGITVLTDLNPWIVSFHLLVSLAMVGLSVVLLRRLDEGDGPARLLVPAGLGLLARAVFGVGWVGAVRRHRGHRQRTARRRRIRAAQRAGPALAEPAAHRRGLPAARADRRGRADEPRRRGARHGPARRGARCSPSSWRRA